MTATTSARPRRSAHIPALRRRVHPALVIVLAFLGLQAAFLSATLAEELVPDSAVSNAIVRGFASNTLNGEDYFATSTGDRADHFTECVGLSIGLGHTRYEHFVARALADPMLGECGSLAALRTTPSEDIEGTPYFRYWHGYAALTRPMLAATSVASTRLVVTVLLTVAFMTLVLVAARRGAAWAVAALLGPLVLTTDLVDTPQAMPHALALATAFLGGALMWWSASRPTSRPWQWALAALIAGSTFAFMDLLTNPPLALALAAFAAGAAVYRSGHGRTRALLAMATTVAGWIIGYAATWASKWVITAAVLGIGTVRENIAGATAMRLNGNDCNCLDLSFGASTRANWNVWINSFEPTLHSEVHRFRLGLILLSAVVIIGLLLAVVLRGGLNGALDAGVLALPALVAPVWFEVLRNHSSIHAFFTYRALALSLGILLAAPLVVLLRPRVAADVRDGVRLEAVSAADT